MVILRDKDYMNYIVRYIDRNLSKGYNKDQLKIMLVNQGYSRAAVEKAVKMVQERMPKPQPVAKEKPKIEYTEVQEKKPGFFARLFGKGKKKVEEEAKIDPETGKLMQ